MSSLLFIILLVYLLGAAGYIIFLFVQKEICHRVAFGLMTAGFTLHTGLIGFEFYRLGYFPAQNLHQTLVVAGWSLTGVFLAIKYRYRLNILGAYAAPLAAIVMIAAFCFPSVAVTPTPLFKSLWLVLHIVIIFIAEAALALACGAGLIYLVQERAIKTKSSRFFLKRLPSLEFLDRTGYLFIVTGFTFLTIGLITGFIYAHLVWGKFWSWDNKEIWSMITWLIYAALLHGRLVSGWRGRRAAVMAVVGFAALLFTFFGVNFLLEGHHDEFTKW
jgi:cytochrome c-type biogenesis protein CcsB